MNLMYLLTSYVPLNAASDVLGCSPEMKKIRKQHFRKQTLRQYIQVLIIYALFMLLISLYVFHFNLN